MWIVIVLIIILIIALVFVPFARDMIKDKTDLQEHPVSERYRTFISIVNQGILEGKGELTTFEDDPRLVNMMDPNRRNVLIQFYYVSKSLRVILNYKWLQVEHKYEKTFYNMDSANLFKQKSMANEFVDYALREMAKHRENVQGSSLGTSNPDIPDYSKGLEPEDDPLGMIQDMYSDFSREDKISALWIKMIFLRP